MLRKGLRRREALGTRKGGLMAKSNAVYQMKITLAEIKPPV